MIKIPLYRGVYEIEPIVSTVSHLGGYILGGYVRYMASPRKTPVPAQDVDIYCPDEETYEKLTKHFDNYLEHRHENYISLTYRRDFTDTHYAHCPTIQLIKPMEEGAIVSKGKMPEILKNFDFTVVRIGMINRRWALADDDFLEDEQNRILKIKNIHCPVSSMLRCMKYARKGYFMRPGEAIKLFQDWMDRDDEYRIRLLGFFQKSKQEGEMTQEDIDELEALLRID